MKNQDLDSWLEYLDSFKIFKTEILQDKLRSLYKKIIKLSPSTKVIIVGGTNGKGSTVEFLTQLLVLNNKGKNENERDKYNRKNISSIRRLSKGRREEKERQGEFRLDTNDSSTFFLPSIDLLNDTQPNRTINNNEDNLENTARMLENVLDDYGIRGEIGRVQAGPVVTRYELEPAPGLRSSRVIGLSDDIARSMSAISTRVAVVALSLIHI